MAEYLSAKALAWTGAIVMLFAWVPVTAETLIDPTRPPAGLGKNQMMEGGPPEPLLQSVLISPNRRIAIISGKTLKIGDKFGDAEIVSINENEVVLQTGKERQTLKMYPSLRKQAPIDRAHGNLENQGPQR